MTKKEAEDINNDGKVTKKEKELLDTNDDGKVNRHEILKAPEADINKDGVVTKQELHKVETLLPPPPPAWLHAPPPPRPPPRTTWPVMGKWNSVEEAIDEVVLLTLCIVTFTQACAGSTGGCREQRRASTRRLASSTRQTTARIPVWSSPRTARSWSR